MPAVAERLLVVRRSPGQRIALSDLRCTYGERLNIAPSGKRFRCNFIEPGLVDYSDVGGDIELLRKETIDEALNSAMGNPLTIGHVSTKIRLADLMVATRGQIDKVGYDPETAWYFCEGEITDEFARDKIRRNAKPSCGYTVTSFGPGGVHHNIRYAREITGIKFHHLAIVENPRYEAADIRLNAKQQGTPAMSLIKWLKKKIVPATSEGGQATETTEAVEMAPDTVLELEGGKTVRLNDVIAAKIASDKKDADDAAARENSIDGEALIEYAPGKTAKLNELTKCYATFGKADHCNETDDDKAKREKEEKDRANAKADAERKNAGAVSFKVLGAARNSPPPPQTERANSANTLQEQLERGKSRYGSAPAAGGKN